MVFCRCLQRILIRSERMVAASTPEDAQEIAALDASFTQKQQSTSMVPRKEPSPPPAQPQSSTIDLTKVFSLSQNMRQTKAKVSLTIS